MVPRRERFLCAIITILIGVLLVLACAPQAPRNLVKAQQENTMQVEILGYHETGRGSEWFISYTLVRVKGQMPCLIVNTGSGSGESCDWSKWQERVSRE